MSETGTKKREKVAIVLLAVMAGLGLLASGLLYLQHDHDQKIINAAGVTSQIEAGEVIGKVSKLMVLPPHEVPSVATISDAGKLPRQKFFARAKNGDKVLIYARAKTAILYDPEKGIIVAVSPLNTRSSARGG